MNYRRLFGFILFVIGVIILIFGINSTQQMGQKVAESFTGQYGEQTRAYIICGSVLIVGGLALTINRRKRK